MDTEREYYEAEIGRKTIPLSEIFLTVNFPKFGCVVVFSLFSVLLNIKPCLILHLYFTSEKGIAKFRWVWYHIPCRGEVLKTAASRPFKVSFL